MSRRFGMIILGILLGACAADSDLVDASIPEKEILLTFPENQSDCTEGEFISETQSRVPFQWELVPNVSTYVLTITDLSTQENISRETDTSMVMIQLKRGTPFAWFVASKANPTKERSETWSFFNEGPGPTNNVPQPAVANSPVDGAAISATSTEVNLRWSAEDADGTSPHMTSISGKALRLRSLFQHLKKIATMHYR